MNYSIFILCVFYIVLSGVFVLVLVKVVLLIKVEVFWKVKFWLSFIMVLILREDNLV